MKTRVEFKNGLFVLVNAETGEVIDVYTDEVDVIIAQKECGDYC